MLGKKLGKSEQPWPLAPYFFWELSVPASQLKTFRKNFSSRRPPEVDWPEELPTCSLEYFPSFIPSVRLVWLQVPFPLSGGYFWPTWR